MRKLLNTLFVTSEDLYLSLENENILAWREKQLLQQIPLLNLENIFYFGYKGASPALLGSCVERNIGFCFLNPYGKFLARVQGSNSGNVLLRKEQYRISDEERRSLTIAKTMIAGKILNSRSVLMRALRNHEISLDQTLFKNSIIELQRQAKETVKATSLEMLRGIEGYAANSYFALMDSLILQRKKHFYFHGRNKRPPKDRMNALLSFAYTLLAHDCASALECVGLDSYVGFLHRDRPGRESLALDLMEEFRSVYADRFALTLVNKQIIREKHFDQTEGGAILLNKEGRKIFLDQWQTRKREELMHPFLNERISWGLLPYVQALLLTRYIRGDLDGYPPFVWK